MLKKHVLFFGLFILVIFTVGIALEMKPLEPNLVLAAQHWDVTPNLILFTGDFGGQNKISIVRGRDAKEQPISDSMQFSYQSHDEMFIFGNVKDKKGSIQQKLYLLNARGATVYRVPESFGLIESISANPKKTYFLMKVNKGHSFYCLYENEPSVPLYCKDLIKKVLPPEFSAVEKKDVYIYWNLPKDRELIIKINQSGNDVFFSYDPWEEKAVKLSSGSDYGMESKYKVNENGKYDFEVKYKRFLFWLFFGKNKKNKYVRRIPLRAKIYGLSDGKHILILNKNKSYILDITNNRLSDFFAGFNIKKVYLYNE